MNTLSHRFRILLFLLASGAAGSRAWAQDSNQVAGPVITINFTEEDSVKQVTLSVTRPNEQGIAIPVAETELIVYAKKSYGLLPLGDAVTTDEDGVASVPFPADLPGDASGTVTVVARIEEHEEFGTVESSREVKWGVPTSPKASMDERALWASGRNAPVPLVLIITGMVAGVWGFIFYVVILLFKINKSGTYEIKNQS